MESYRLQISHFLCGLGFWSHEAQKIHTEILRKHLCVLLPSRENEKHISVRKQKYFLHQESVCVSKVKCFFNFCKNASVSDGEVVEFFSLPFPLTLIFSPHKDQVNFSYYFKAKPSIVVHL